MDIKRLDLSGVEVRRSRSKNAEYARLKLLGWGLDNGWHVKRLPVRTQMDMRSAVVLKRRWSGCCEIFLGVGAVADKTDLI